ncbi:putative pentatricopeptide repeat-containing protein At1g12700, mitochondrial [Hibiscus syriacus]|uniref:putative pentatricopeptide repeat-containing protein At1g12700, mitochondrial n=1 Tax=Hibiscus syriacus TaxID=106335 RepID=UPI0019224CF2|nr:putative pentatricopeptide repeat-containing protein At1g12700, mitochondrial [Hibiscus syriacus]
MIREAEDIVETMIKRGVEPNVVVTYNSSVDAHCENGMVSKADDIVESMIKRGVELNVVTYSALIDSHCSQNNVDKARRVLQLMIENRWRISAACELLRKMVALGQVPDIVSCSILVHSVCKRAGQIKVAKELFHDLLVNGLKPNVYAYAILINGLCKEGLPDEAYKLFRSIKDDDCLPNSDCYNGTIQGFLRTTIPQRQHNFFKEMVGKGFSADLCTATLYVDRILRSNDSI